MPLARYFSVRMAGCGIRLKGGGIEIEVRGAKTFRKGSLKR